MRRLPVLVVCLLALAAGPASAQTRSGFVTMDDGIRLAYDLVVPDGAAPASGWPAVLVMHGLGGSKDQMLPLARDFAARGLAALAYSVRGQGTSGGTLDLAGPRDVADTKAMVAWLESQPGISRTQVGCFGISLGGGECWNATPSGIFRAVVPVATWTDLASAFWPGGVSRSGALAGFAGPAGTATGGVDMTLVHALTDGRSVLRRLGSVRTPVYLFQGREDGLFPVDQATAAFARLAGPKRLYVGDFGHPPASFSSPDFPSYALAQSVAWFRHWLAEAPNGIDAGAPVTIADRTGRRRASFAGLPRTKSVGAGFRGTTASRTGPRFGQALETFGQSILRVQVRRLARYPQLVAVLTANGRVVTDGAVVPHRGLNTIRLAAHVVYLPRGTRLRLRLGAGGGSYRAPASVGSISLGPAFLSLQTLARPVSR